SSRHGPAGGSSGIAERSETDLVLARVDRVKLASPPGKPGGAEHGAIAQLVERLHGMQEVRSSILLSSTEVEGGSSSRMIRLPRCGGPASAAQEIGRASCRETVLTWVGAAAC